MLGLEQTLALKSFGLYEGPGGALGAGGAGGGACVSMGEGSSNTTGGCGGGGVGGCGVGGCGVSLICLGG